jgi:PBP1b-binding outer membrane lipoprotein LpoB
MFMALLLAGCSSLVFQPAPVGPTNSPLPYSAKVKLSQVEAYLVKPGATMIADPHIENHVTGASNSLEKAKKD